MATITLQPRFRTLLAAFLLASAILFAPLARAETELPAAVVQATNPTDAQKQEVAKYATAALDLFKSPQWADAKRGRDQILRPFEEAAGQASVAFRLEYTKVLVPALSTLAGKDNPDLTRLNAIRILGAIATAQSASALEPFFADPSPSIRFMACQAAGTTFRALATGSPALPSGEATRLIGRLATLAGAEKDPTVVDGAVIALTDATKVEIANYAEVREGAFTLLASTMSTRLQALPTDSQDVVFLATALRAGVAARDGLIGRSELSAEVNRELGAFGGDLVAYVLRRAKAGDMPAPGSGQLRLTLEQLASTGEANVFYAILALKATREPTAVSAVLQSGNAATDAQFIPQAEAFVRANLVAAPLNFPADRFLK